MKETFREKLAKLFRIPIEEIPESVNHIKDPGRFRLHDWEFLEKNMELSPEMKKLAKKCRDRDRFQKLKSTIHHKSPKNNKN